MQWMGIPRLEPSAGAGSRGAVALAVAGGTGAAYGLSDAWFLAASPMRRSVSENATYEGVTRLPWSLAMISTLPAEGGSEMRRPGQLCAVGGADGL